MTASYTRAGRAERTALRYRLSVASRTVAAVFGGYGVASLTVFAWAFASPGDRAQGVLAGTMASFAVYAAAIIWGFAARTALQAWAGLAGAALVLSLIATAGWSLGA